MYHRRVMLGALCVSGLVALGCSGMGGTTSGAKSSGGKGELRVGKSDIKKGKGAKGPAAASAAAESRKNQYTVKLREGVKDLTFKKGSVKSSDSELDTAFGSLGISGAAKVHGFTPKNSQIAGYLGLERTLTFTSKKPREKVLAKLEAHPDVEWVESVIEMKKASMPNDPYYSYQWHMQALQVDKAWDITMGEGVIVAVVDTGVSVGEDGFHKLVAGYDFVENDTTPQDGNQHGSHVAGTIGQAANNGIGVVGVAPMVSIMPVRVLGDDGGGSNTWVASGIIWAVDHGANIINLSLGSQSNSEVVADACAYAYEQGVTVVAATGNDGFVDYIGYPAALPTTIAVGSVDAKNKVAFYSNQGKEIDLVAPGGDSGVDTNGDGQGDGVVQETVQNGQWGYYFLQGTSMATPHVSGAAALLYSKGVTDPDQMRRLLTETADDLGASGWDSTYGAGAVNPVRALEKTKSGKTSVAAAKLEILNAKVKSVSDTRAVVRWKTNIAASSALNSKSDQSLSAKDKTKVSMHSMTISGQKGETVQFQIVSVADGEQAKRKLSHTF